MKILIITPFFKGGCGIWKRVENDALALKEAGHEVVIFTSNRIKGTKNNYSNYENWEGIDIHRFRIWFSFGGNSMFFFIVRKLLKIKPEIIHVHGYRHPASLQGALMGFLFRKKTLITTHAPFGKDPRRNFILKSFDLAYDILIGWWELKIYKRIISIAKWEKPYLKKLFANDSKVKLIPNGINNEFFDLESENIKKHLENNNPEKRIFYMGRLDPVKRVEWLMEAAKGLPEYEFNIIGPLSGYSESVFQHSLSNLNIKIKAYDKHEFIEQADKSDIYVMASIREALGQTPLEAMARGCVVIATPTKGLSDYLIDGENGFFVNSPEELIRKIEEVYSNWNNLLELKKNSISTANEFRLEKFNQLLIEEYNEM
jgi:glycosyltransferase involved in cell wall biosynthesis